MNTEEFPKGGELDSLHLSLIEKKFEFEDFHPKEEISETMESPLLDYPSPLKEPSVDNSNSDLGDDIVAESNDFLQFPPKLDSNKGHLSASNPSISSFPNDIPGDSKIEDVKDLVNGDVVKDKHSASNNRTQNRRSSIELRLQGIVQSKSTSIKPPSSNIITKPSQPLDDIPSPLASMYDIDIKSITPHRDLLPLLPMETNFIYGPSHDASTILNDIKADESKTLHSATLSDATSRESAGTPASATSWLSKSPAILDEPKYQLTFPNGNLPVEIANSKRNSEFRELFPSLDPQDRLVNDFTCAWLTDMLMHGRMYITQNNVCFYTKVIWTYQCVIPIADIISIEKKVVGRLFDNALEIKTKDKDAYDLIIKVIDGYPNSSVELKPQIDTEVTKRITSHASLINGDGGRRSRSLGSMDDTSKMTDQVTHSRSSIEIDGERKTAVGLAEIVSASISDGSSTEAYVLHFGVESNLDLRTTTSPEKAGSISSAAGPSKKFIIHQKHKVITPTTRDLANTSTKIAPHASAIKSGLQTSISASTPFECPCIKSVHLNQTKCLDTIVALSVMESWQYLYSFESLQMAFCQKLWKKLGFTDIKGSDWVSPDSDLSDEATIYNSSIVEIPLKFSNLRVGFKRKIEYTRPIANPVGPKSSKVLIEEKILSIAPSHVCIESISSTPSAPSGDCFKVRNRFCILSNGGEPTTRLITSCCIEYIKSTWMKVILDSAVPGGVRDYQIAMEKELHLYIKSGGIPKPEVKTREGSSSLQAPVTLEMEALGGRKSSTAAVITSSSFWSIFSNRIFLGLMILLQFVVNTVVIFFIYKLNTKLDILQLSNGISQKSEDGEL